MARGRPLIEVLAQLAPTLEAELTKLAHDKLLAIHEPRLRRKMTQLWRQQERVFLQELSAHRALFREASAAWWGPAWEAAISATRAGMISALVTEMSPLYTAGLAAVLGAAGTPTQDVLAAGLLRDLQLPNPRAVAFLQDHAARRVTGIDATTEDGLRQILAQGADEGWSYSRTARAIQDEFRGFSAPAPQKHIANRAELVSVTELAEGYGMAQREMALGLRGVGVEMEKSWLIGAADPCEICQLNDADGWIGLDDAFSGGAGGVPQHPACRCDVIYRRAR